MAGTVGKYFFGGSSELDKPYKEVLQIRSLFLVNIAGVVLSLPNNVGVTGP